MGKLINIVKLLLAFIIAVFAKPFMNKKDIWLISEFNGMQARDNGYYFYKHIADKHPKVNAYYVIDNKSQDKHKLKIYSKVIMAGSFKHYIFYVNAAKLISTHLYGCAPGAEAWRWADRLVTQYKKHVFMQHIEGEWNNKDDENRKAKLDLFVCGTENQYKIAKKKVVDNIINNNCKAQYLGQPRYDVLHLTETKPLVLVMPAFRPQLLKASNKELMKCEYYYRYQSLLNNTVLHNILKNYGLELVFCPNLEPQRGGRLFATSSDRIIIDDRNIYETQQLVRDSRLLITDCSSVESDFAYMRKPIIYYEFDTEQCEGTGCTDLGKSFSDEEDLLFELNRIIESDYKTDEYAVRHKEIFKIWDTGNCKRLFDAVNAL